MWNEKLDEKTRKSLNKLLLEVSKEKNLYKNSSKIQIWIALALLNSKIEDLNLKLSSKDRKVTNIKKSLNKL